jgi:hypothetical protein
MYMIDALRICPGKPTENAYAKSLYGRLSDAIENNQMTLG